MHELSRRGELRFDEYVDMVLYHPSLGFYSRGGGAGGRRGDFLTSPETGPLFGAVLARALDTWWQEAGEPDPYVVVEAGAGRGTLARSILQARPRCREALWYVLVEASRTLRREHGRIAHNSDGLARRVESLEDISLVGASAHVVLANELLDNLPFRILEARDDGWWELHVKVEGGRLREVLRPAGPGLPEPFESLGTASLRGRRFPLLEAARHWVSEALERLATGRLVVIDYGVLHTRDLVDRDEWLRCYDGHRFYTDPLEDPGARDVTTDVCFDQLAAVYPPHRITRQADFLREHGIDELVEEGRRIWTERAHVGDLEAVRARSRVHEAKALVDETCFGSYLVAEWIVNRGRQAV